MEDQDAVATGQVVPLDEAAALLTIEEAAQVLRISRSSMYRLIRGRHIEFTKYPGSATVVSREAIRKFIEASTVQPAAS